MSADRCGVDIGRFCDRTWGVGARKAAQGLVIVPCVSKVLRWGIWVECQRHGTRYALSSDVRAAPLFLQIAIFFFEFT